MVESVDQYINIVVLINSNNIKTIAIINSV